MWRWFTCTQCRCCGHKEETGFEYKHMKQSNRISQISVRTPVYVHACKLVDLLYITLCQSHRRHLYFSHQSQVWGDQVKSVSCWLLVGTKSFISGEQERVA